MLYSWCFVLGFVLFCFLLNLYFDEYVDCELAFVFSCFGSYFWIFEKLLLKFTCIKHDRGLGLCKLV